MSSVLTMKAMRLDLIFSCMSLGMVPLSPRIDGSSGWMLLAESRENNWDLASKKW
jgi:hypothetical protein